MMWHKSILLATVVGAALLAVSSVGHGQVTNLVPNPSFEEDEVILNDPDWTDWCTWNPAEGEESTAEFDDTEAIDGSRSLRVDPIGTVNWHFIVALISMPGTVGTEYTASFWAKAAAPRPMTAQMKSGDNSVTWGVTTFDLTEEWAEYHFTASAQNATIKLEFLCAASETPLWLDFVQFYEGQYVAGIMPSGAGIEAKAAAKEPSPEDGASEVPPDATLSWQPGAFADTHTVYFGESFDDVNNATTTDPLTATVMEGLTDTMFDPDGLLEFGKTYYWRVDEANAPPDSTVFKGEVWSFEVEPYAYPITDVSATASSSDKVNNGPSKTVDGSGLDGDAHSTESEDMWVSSMAGPQPTWIWYEFDDVYTLDHVLVWNYNGENEQVLGYGFKDVTVEYSLDGEQWTPLGDYELSQAPADPAYEADSIDLDGSMAKFVRLTANSNWSTFGIPMYGLSEVRFHYIPLKARLPHPDTGGQDVPVDVVLTWRPGRKAASHDVYLSSDEQEVLDGTALVDATTDASYAPLPLDYGRPYYWRVDEVNEVEVPGLWQGDLWSFTTTGFKVIDDFESYTAEVGEEIFTAWADGFDDDGNGSVVGHDFSSNDTFGETTIVQNGSQSMPLFYDNGTATVSEATYSLAGEDWTASGIKSLSLHFYGDPENSGQLYLKINGTKVPYEGDLADITEPLWQPWNVDLSTVSTNLSNVTSLTIGVEGAGASGVLYLDDVRLYPKEPQFVTPVAPNSANLVASYALDGNADDGSGNGLHGAVMGDAQWVAGYTGDALAFDGIDDYVDCGAGAAFDIDDQLTLAVWVRPETAGNGQHYAYISKGDHSYAIKHNNSNNFEFVIYDDTWYTAIHPLDATFNGEWHHVAGTYDGADLKLYFNGILVDTTAHAGGIAASTHSVNLGRNSEETDRLFSGALDDARIYDRVLSDAEIAWLAGKREPMPKPF